MSLNEHRERAPWYITAITTVAALARELLRSEPECVIHSVEDLEAIVRIAQGG